MSVETGYSLNPTVRVPLCSPAEKPHKNKKGGPLHFHFEDCGVFFFPLLTGFCGPGLNCPSVNSSLKTAGFECTDFVIVVFM